MTLNHFRRAGISRDSVVAILMLVVFALTIACVVIFPYLQPKQYTATALFLVSASEISLSGEPIPFDPRRDDILRKTQLAYLKSFFVLQSALRAPGIGALAILAPHDDKVTWLKDNLDVSFAGEDSEILQIKLHGTEEQSEDMRKIVDAVCDAYLKEVVFEEEQRRLVFRDVKQRASTQVRGKLEQLILKRNESTSKSPDAIAAREADEAEIRALTEAWERVLAGLAIDDMDAVKPDRIRLIQKATVLSDDDPLSNSP